MNEKKKEKTVPEKENGALPDEALDKATGGAGMDEPRGLHDTGKNEFHRPKLGNIQER